MSAHTPGDLGRIYESRFRGYLEYRRAVWRVLIADYFKQFILPTDAVLDLGCGYGEFINQVECGSKFAMDLNPDAANRIVSGVKLLQQDCSAPWPLPEASLDVVFTSNFFEHLPSKAALGRTLDEIRRCLKPGGMLIALGPNIKYLPGKYWDFWDHYVPLTETSLAEALESRGFSIRLCAGKFLPYAMARDRQYPVALLRLYLRLPLAWRLVGRQFLVVAARS
ncbi:MAG: class I SAM-dependent methyltransferase [Candidatus Binatia bacterium]